MLHPTFCPTWISNQWWLREWFPKHGMPSLKIKEEFGLI